MEPAIDNAITAEDRAMWATEQAMRLISDKDRENLTTMEQKLLDYATVIQRVAFVGLLLT